MSTLRPDIQWELELASGGTSTARGTAAAKAAHTGRGQSGVMQTQLMCGA